MLDYNVLTTSMANPSLLAVFYAFLLSFVLGTVIAVLYIKTFQGLSYSRNFLHCLVLCPILTAIAMQAIGDNVARGIGMIGAISILRFRTNIKDPRDMFFIFASLAVGLAAGVHAYSIATIGGLCFVAATLVLSKTPFAHGPQFDALLRLQLRRDESTVRDLEKALTDNCRHFAMISVREMGQGDHLDYAYQLKFKPQVSDHAVLQAIQRISGAKGINLMKQESVIEV
ncbi:MAG TPA: DUF4956 domain-containing protein [Pseudobdellovibrionaceae bacterium]|nr:DUF4956 domain-containing protein [Pseudobdellovibrionaceae bacterium]